MGIFKRLFGICDTPLPSDPQCWSIANGQIEIDLGRAIELKGEGRGLRLEGNGLSKRVLVLRGPDKKLHAFENKCTHGGRRLDPVDGGGRVQCCSVGRSLFETDGTLVSGSAKKDIKILDVSEVEGKAVVLL